MSKSEDASVLVVDDEPSLTELFQIWLEREYDVVPAFDGEEALERLDESIDVVLLDRNMPGLSGDEVLEEIRRQQLGCRVAMVTAIEPDFDVIELGFDDYLVKPIFRKELIEAVEKLLTLNHYDEAIQEYFALVSKMAALQSAHEPYELKTNEEYLALQSQVESIRRNARQEFEEIEGHDDFATTFRRLSRHWDVYSPATVTSD